MQAEGTKTADEVRQEYNGLIETTISLVDANKSNADSIFDVTKAMQASFDTIVAKANEALDTVESVYSTFLNAAQEFADSGFITVDTFQQILSQGAKYLAYLVDENGQLNITEDAIHRVIAAKTEQVAIETALNYISAIRQALIDDQTDTLNNLIYATDNATDSTWGLVNASLAQLKLLGLSDEQYQAVANQVIIIDSSLETGRVALRLIPAERFIN